MTLHAHSSLLHTCLIYKRSQVADKHTHTHAYCQYVNPHIFVMKQYGGGWFIITSSVATEDPGKNSTGICLCRAGVSRYF